MSENAPGSNAIPPSQFYGTSTPSIRAATPPPTATKFLSPDTPTNPRLASSQLFSSFGAQFVEPAFVKAAEELKGKVVTVSVKKFLATHLPHCPPNMPEIDWSAFENVAEQRAEVDMYEPLIAALVPFLKKDWKMVNTSNSPDPNSIFFLDHQIKPDITVYSEKPPSNNNACRACDMETFMELKPREDSDGFGDDTDAPEKVSGEARDTRGQLVTYLNAMQAAQYRKHGFGVLIVANKCRLIRHTRSGIEITPPFRYDDKRKHPFLQEFFWRFSHASPEARGIDTSFEPMPPFDALWARSTLDARNGVMWKVQVGERSFYVTAPFTRSHHYPFGRGTRCFVAVDCDTQQKCLLKDSWRLDGYHPEGEVYERLHANNVRNIPNVLAAGDVHDHACGIFPDGWYLPTNSTIRVHSHYRLVLDVVGQPIVDFESTYALTRYILDALEAHFDAVTLAQVEHRDISAGNIIVFHRSDGTAKGLLIDWELSKYLDETGPRAYEKTGTWQFMAARLCGENPPLRTLGDDLESFVLLILWIAARYAPNNMSPHDRATFLQHFEHQHAAGKIDLLTSRTIVTRLYLVSVPLEGLLMDLLDGYQWRYTVISRRDLKRAGALEELEKKRELLESHNWLMETIRNGLDDNEWKAMAEDRADREQKVAVIVGKATEKKRKSQCPEYASLFANKRMKRGERGPRPVQDESEGEE